MYFGKNIIFSLVLSFGITQTFCMNMGADLLPDGSDRRTENSVDFIGVGEQSPDLSLFLLDNVESSLYNEGAVKRGVVLYFTMWCSICNAHTSHIIANFKSQHPDVAFIVIDYVTGDLDVAKNIAISSGLYNAIDIGVDLGGAVQKAFAGTMATTVVIDSANTVRMNEDFRDGAALGELLPLL